MTRRRGEEEACAASSEADAAGGGGSGSARGFGGGLDACSEVPSTMMAEPQRLQVMRAFLPRTFSSGTAYLAGQEGQATFMLRKIRGSRLGEKYHEGKPVAKR